LTTIGALKLLTQERLNRIRWRSRRGMLENDLVLTRYLDQRGTALTEDEVAMLDRLLDLPDNELWDLIAGLQEPDDAAVAPLLKVLRTA
jgi:antitoxin CptB